MKRLPIFLATLMLTLITAGTSSANVTSACLGILGYWSNIQHAHLKVDSFNSSSLAFSGTYNSEANPNCQMTYSGTWDAAIQGWDYTTAYVSGTCPAPWTGHITGATGAGCTNFSDDHFTVYWNRKDSTYTNNDCEVPGTPGTGGNVNGEASSVWDGNITTNLYYEAASVFHAGFADHFVFQPFSFSGRHDTETIVGPNDMCLGTTVQDELNGSTWNVDQYNDSVGLVLDDKIGLRISDDGTLTPVDYVSKVLHQYELALPCSITTTQTMAIDCPDSNGGSTTIQYEVHENVISIYDGYMKIGRNGIYGNPIYIGKTRQIYKWDDGTAWPLEFYFQ